MDKSIRIVSDSHERLNSIIKERLPWLIIGLAGGTAISFLVSRFEAVLASNLSLAFFLPLIVYMSSAVGTQTETIFVRDITGHRIHFFKYLLKEIMVGFYLGILLGILISIIAFVWLGSLETAFTVGIAMFLNVLIAPAVSILIPEALFKEHTDPALGAGPFTTVIQDFISILIYFVVATAVLWNQLPL